MGREEQIINERKRKLKELRRLVNPYPHRFDVKDYSSEVKEKFKGLKDDERTKSKVRVAGRVMTVRNLGKLIFATVQDSKGRMQIILQKGVTADRDFGIFKKYVDAGDFVGVEGLVMKSRTGEVSVLVKKAEMLSKSLLPLPEKWHGLKDDEERYRKRYLDLVMNPEVRGVFDKRTMILDSIRELLKKKGMVEVDTPFLQTIYGGAAAKPFKTHLNALDIDLFLAISPELYLKRLIVGGYDKVYTISRNFRNEGIDRWHNPEFSMMEIYCAYNDYNDMMDLFEEIYEYVAKKVNGSTKVKFRGEEIDFKRPWKRMSMASCIKKYAKIDVDKKSAKELASFVKKNKIESKDDKSWGWNVQAIFEHFCEEKLEQPTFILDHPLETTPLCKIHRNEKMCRMIERFEPFCMGAELGNAYSELNDPELQRSLLEEQQASLSKGDEEANPLDEDFINAIEVGMPPTGGLGLGIDRMVMLLTGQDSIKDVIMFPFMRPLDVEDKKKGDGKKGK
ncbi:lysine--tRNA ligase [Candidatus Pacearchaeota archaeon]|nr:lysine--tRNA ligase [Candidatus Pacearchaeota archaeon]